MTKVDLRYELTHPIDETLMDRISKATSLFGLLRVHPNEALNELLVEYDASRLTLAQVESALHMAGIPAKRK